MLTSNLPLKLNLVQSVLHAKICHHFFSQMQTEPQLSFGMSAYNSMIFPVRRKTAPVIDMMFKFLFNVQFFPLMNMVFEKHTLLFSDGSRVPESCCSEDSDIDLCTGRKNLTQAMSWPPYKVPPVFEQPSNYTLYTEVNTVSLFHQSCTYRI